MARAWFYLTLWRGTPPEFTTEAEAAVGADQAVTAALCRETEAEARVLRETEARAAIRESTTAEAEIITERSVIWHVGLPVDLD